jgi:hypothetical protein
MRGNTVRKQVLVYAGVALALAVAALAWFLLTQRDVERLLVESDRVQVLVIGQNDADGVQAIALLSFSEEDAVIVSIPADLRVREGSGAFQRAAELLTSSGPDAVRASIASLTGVEIPFHIVVDATAILPWVEDLGGVPVTLDAEAVYQGVLQSGEPVERRFLAGSHRLQGQDALLFATAPSDPGDIGLWARQAILLRGLLLEGMASWPSDGDARGALRTARAQMETQLSVPDLTRAVELLRGIAEEDVDLYILPGDDVEIGGVTYTQPRVVEIERLISLRLRGLELVTPEDTRVALFNGNGSRGAAARTGEYLSLRGFQTVVPGTGNADHFLYETSHVIVLTEEPKAWLVRDALPVEATIEFPESLPTTYEAVRQQVPTGTDVVVIVGIGLEFE